MASQERSLAGAWPERRLLAESGDRIVALLVLGGLAYLPWEILSPHDDAHARLCDLAFLVAGGLASWLVLRASRTPGLAGATGKALHRIAWGYVAYWLGDLVWSLSNALTGEAPPFGLHRAFYLAYYALLLWGALSFPRAERSLRGRLFWLDSAAVVVGSAMVVWYVALERATRTAADDPGAAWLFVAFAIGDLLLLLAFALMILRGAHPERRQAFLVLAFGVLLAMLGHGLYSAIAFAGLTGIEATPDTVVMLSWICAGLGGHLYRRLGGVAGSAVALTSALPVLSVIPFGAIGLGYGVLLLASLQRTATAGLVAGAALLTAIVVARQVVAGAETAHLLAEQTRLSQKARFETLVESSADVTFLVGADARFRYASRSIGRVLGREPADVLGVDVFSLMHPDDIEASRRVFEHCLANPGVPHHAEFRFRHGNGEWRVIEADGMSRVGDPEIDAVVASFRDVTVRRTQDEGLRATERELRAQKDLLANLLAVARATTEQPTLETTLRNTLGVMLRITGASGGSMFLFDEAGAVRSSVYVDARAQTMRHAHESDEVIRDGLAGWVARHREGVIVPDVERDDRWLALGEDIASVLCVPIQSGGALLGILTLVHPEKAYFEPHHLEFASAAVDPIALALRNAQVFDALGAMARRLRLLNDIVHDAGLRLDPDALLRSAVESIARRTSWRNVVLSVPDEERRHWRIRASAEDMARVGRQRVDEGVAGRAFVTGKTQLVPDVRLDPDYIAGSPLVLSELCVPLRRGERVLGVLNLESDRLNAFGEEDVRLAEALAETLALSLDDARLYRKLAEESERLDAVIRSSRDGILLGSAQGRVLVMNDPAARFFSLTGNAARWLDRPLAELAGAVPAPILQALREGEDRSGELELKARVIAWRATPVSAGASEARLLVVRDVTEARRLERMRDELTDTIVHDLRSPLNSITGFLQTLEDTALPKPQSELLAIAGRASRRLLSLVDTILDVSRLEKGAMPLERRDIDVAGAIRSVLEMQLPVARLRGVRLSSDCEEGPLRFSADPELLSRVLENLLSNALRHSPRGGEVKVQASADAGELRVAVSDDGPGIPEADALRIFDKFVSGDRVSRNSGLGLAFCKLAVEAHGGRIGVERPARGGAVFTFTIPAA